jgi:hypothetical protein
LTTRRRTSLGGERNDTSDTAGDIAIAVPTQRTDITGGDGLTRDHEAHDDTTIPEKIGTGDAENEMITRQNDVREEDTIQRMRKPLDATAEAVMTGATMMIDDETRGAATAARHVIGSHDTTRKMTTPRRRRSASASWQRCNRQPQSLTKTVRSG